jgi:hypothetical protein
VGERITISSVFPTSPYYINDILYAGLREDLLRLCRFDIAPEYIFNWLEAEHFTHSPLSRDLFPLLQSYLQIHPPFWHGQPEKALDLLDAQLASDCFMDVLAANLRMIAAYYQLGFTPPVGSHAASFRHRSLREILGSDTGLPGCTFLSGPGVAAFTSAAPLTALLDGCFLQDEAGRRFMSAVERTSDYQYVAGFEPNPFRPHPAIAELAEQLQAVRFAESKIRSKASVEPLRWEIRGAPERVAVTTHTDTTIRMEQEIAELRRELQRLQAVSKVAPSGVAGPRRRQAIRS